VAHRFCEGCCCAGEVGCVGGSGDVAGVVLYCEKFKVGEVDAGGADGLVRAREKRGGTY
jgi:hypothetical protein